jgi:hypothetical protein
MLYMTDKLPGHNTAVLQGATCDVYHTVFVNMQVSINRCPGTRHQQTFNHREHTAPCRRLTHMQKLCRTLRCCQVHQAAILLTSCRLPPPGAPSNIPVLIAPVHIHQGAVIPYLPPPLPHKEKGKEMERNGMEWKRQCRSPSTTPADAVANESDASPCIPCEVPTGNAGVCSTCMDTCKADSMF